MLNKPDESDIILNSKLQQVVKLMLKMLDSCKCKIMHLKYRFGNMKLKES